MITFSQLGKFGRLGNVLWQYAALRGIGLKTNTKVVLPSALYKWHGQLCLINHFQIDCDRVSPTELQKFPLLYSNIEYPQLFDIGAFTISGDTDYVGYFQNLKYFDGYEHIIKKEFQFVKPLFNTAKTYHKKLQEKIGTNPLVSIQIRRGDLTLQAERQGVDLYGKSGLYTKYLEQALLIVKKILGQNINFLVFTGGNRGKNLQSDMDWCKQFIYGDNIFYCENMQDIEDFAIMSMCDHNVNGMATSFGWWAAYLNSNPNKIVIAPKKYCWEWKDIPPKCTNANEFYPKEWIIV